SPDGMREGPAALFAVPAGAVEQRRGQPHGYHLELFGRRLRHRLPLSAPVCTVSMSFRGQQAEASPATEAFPTLFSKVFGGLFGEVFRIRTTLETRRPNKTPNRTKTARARFGRRTLATPPPANGDAEAGAVTPDPSLPTTGSRDRGSP